MNWKSGSWKAFVILSTLFTPSLVSGQSTSELRIITYNLRSGRGYGQPNGMTTVQRFRSIGQEIGRYQPDVLVIQEPGSNIEMYDTLVAAMGNAYRYLILKCPDYSEANRVGLLVVNNQVTIDSVDHCIEGDSPEAHSLFNHWARTVISFQNKHLVIYGFKLAPRDRYETRRRQIDVLAPYLEKDLAQQKQVVVAGDLNHRPFDKEHSRWMTMGLIDSYDSLEYGSGFTKMDELGNDILVPYRRIDYLLLSENLAKLLKNSPQTLQEGLFIPDPPRRSWSLSDHLPVVATFRLDK